MMKLSSLEFVRLLPAWMRDDPAVIALAAAVDELIPQFEARAQTLPTWGHIDKLTEAELDALAWELNIEWYDKSASLLVKRDLIKNSDDVYAHVGTKWAVENVIRSYIGSGNIEEWHEYEGQPGHFRVKTSNPAVTDQRLQEFIAILNKVKRASSVLDGVYISMSGYTAAHAGVGVREHGHERHYIGMN